MRQRHTPYRLGDLSNFLKTTPLLGTQEVMSTGTCGAQTISTMRGKFVRQIGPVCQTDWAMTGPQPSGLRVASSELFGSRTVT